MSAQSSLQKRVVITEGQNQQHSTRVTKELKPTTLIFTKVRQLYINKNNHSKRHTCVVLVVADVFLLRKGRFFKTHRVNVKSHKSQPSKMLPLYLCLSLIGHLQDERRVMNTGKFFTESSHSCCHISASITLFLNHVLANHHFEPTFRSMSLILIHSIWLHQTLRHLHSGRNI